MCGRVVLTLSAKMIEAILNDVLDIDTHNVDEFVPRYNIGPGQQLLSVIQHQEKNRAGYMKWQFVPSFAGSENDGYKFINARSESIHEKRSFMDAFLVRRCLVLCDGFYEWHREESSRSAHFFHHQNKLFALGGIWNPYIQKDGSKQYGISLITTDANETMAPFHHRLPVIIPFDDADKWLNQQTELSTLQTLMQPINASFLDTYPVSDYVNKVANNDEKCIERVT